MKMEIKFTLFKTAGAKMVTLTSKHKVTNKHGKSLLPHNTKIL